MHVFLINRSDCVILSSYSEPLLISLISGRWESQDVLYGLDTLDRLPSCTKSEPLFSEMSLINPIHYSLHISLLSKRNTWC